LSVEKKSDSRDEGFVLLLDFAHFAGFVRLGVPLSLRIRGQTPARLTGLLL